MASHRQRNETQGRDSPRRRRRRTRRRKHDVRTFKIWRGEQGKGDFVEYKQDVVEGMVVLDAVHEIQATQANDLAVPLELQGRQVRLVLGGDQRHAEADVHDAAVAISTRRSR